jgi:hypothetical protein
MKDLRSLLFNLVFCLLTVGLLFGARDLAGWLTGNSLTWRRVGMAAGCGLGYLIWNVADRRRKAWLQQPRLRTQKIATLQLPSGTLVAKDAVLPESPAVVSGFLARELEVFVETIHFPSGGKRVHRIWARTGTAKVESEREVGRISVDSATIYLADQQIIEHHWQDEGEERCGELMSLSAKNGAALAQQIAEKFQLHVRPQRSPCYWEFEERISETLEEQINRFVKEAPVDAWFSVIKMDTSDQISRGLRNTLWTTLQWGGQSQVQLVGVVPGLGDGNYPVIGLFVGEQIVGAEIRFFGEEQEELLKSFPLLKT